MPPAVWRDRDFSRLWAGQSVSVFGSRISPLALPLIAIIVLHATTFEVALVGTIDTVPFIALSLPAGVWVDRLRKRPILVGASVGRALALVTIPLASVMGALTIWQIYGVGIIAGTLTVFFDVAWNSYIPDVVAHKQLVDANSKLFLSESVAQVGGPGIGGALVGLIGGPAAVLIDAFSFLVSAVSIASIRRPETPSLNTAGGRMRREMAEGLRYVLGHDYLRPILIAGGMINFWSSFYGAVVLLFASRALHLTPGVIGLVFAIGNSGAIAGATLARRVTNALGLGRTLLVAGLLIGAPQALLAVATPDTAVPLFLIALTVGEFFTGTFSIEQISLRQTVTPRALQGRMASVMRLSIFGSVPIGAALAGGFATLAGLRASILVGAVGVSLCVVPILLSPLRSLARIPTGEAPERLATAVV